MGKGGKIFVNIESSGFELIVFIHSSGASE